MRANNKKLPLTALFTQQTSVFGFVCSTKQKGLGTNLVNSRLVEPEMANLPNQDMTEPARTNTGDQQSMSTSISLLLSPTKDANGTITCTRSEYLQNL